MCSNLRQLAAFLTMAAMFISCAGPQSAPEAETQIDTRPPSKTEAVPSDEEITSVITTKLYADPLYSPDEVKVQTQKGVVTLSGTVDNLQEKNRAISSAKPIRGVRSIVDLLRVRPALRSDQQIRDDVRKSLKLDPSIESKDFTVRVYNGVVFLQGTVDSWIERSLVEFAASRVTGVKEVQDQVQVKFRFTRPDADIQKDIEGRLRADPWIAENLLSVQVRNGYAALSGTVGSLAALDRADASARISGVRSVDTHAVKVIPHPLHRYLSNDPFLLQPDVQIKSAIHDAFRLDPRLDRSSIVVLVNSGVVELTGQVRNLIAKNAAEETAWNTRGVVEVFTRLTVRPSSHRSDAKLRRDVLFALGLDSLLSQESIRVKADSGIVELQGRVSSPTLKRLAGQVASQVQGVTAVQNRLEVPLASTVSSPREDLLLKRRITRMLRWTPELEANDVITTTVRNGKAELSGIVSSWAEHRNATRIAFEAGAKTVLNSLKVREAPHASSRTFNYETSPPAQG